MVERGQDDLGELSRRVDHDVVEVPAQGGHHLVDVLGGDHVCVGGAERRRQDREPELVLFEVLLHVLVEVVVVDRLAGEQVRDGEPRPEVQRRGDLAELQVEVDQADPLAGLRREVAGQIGGVERLATPAARRRHGEDLGEVRPLHDDAVGDDRAASARRPCATRRRCRRRASAPSTAGAYWSGTRPDPRHPVRTMSARLALGLGPRARTTAGTAAVARSVASRAMPAWLSKTGPATRTSKGPCSRTSSDDVGHVGAGDDLVARTERGLDGPAQCRRPTDDENAASDHGADLRSGRCRCTAATAADWCPSGSGRPTASRSGRGTASVLACPALTARSSVSEDGMVRPDDDGWLAYDGAVLSTSSTWMFAMASSVHGSGRVEVSRAPGRHLGDVRVDVDAASWLQVAGQRRSCHSR